MKRAALPALALGRGGPLAEPGDACIVSWLWDYDLILGIAVALWSMACEANSETFG